MYLNQSLFSDFISGIMLAINLFLWFFKYKMYVIIAVFDSTESGNAQRSPCTALFMSPSIPTGYMPPPRQPPENIF